VIKKTTLCLGLLVLLCCQLSFSDDEPKNTALTQEQQQAKTPQDVLQRLKEGNMRFVNEETLDVDYSKVLRKTQGSQHPAAILLSCIDSRVPPEIVFDQAVGNIFVSRVAGNVLNDDAVAGMEYATHVVGAKLIVVLGHEDCGAVESACKDVKLGYITQLLQKIAPAIAKSRVQMPTATCAQKEYIDLITRNNVREVVAEVQQQSDIIRQDIADGKVEVVGAIYHTKSGDVEFLDDAV
jgi:carbonic anhydrase